jgi:hypothetical protein
MAETHGVGRFFWHPLRLLPETPWFHTSPTQETDAPFRRSTSLIIHLMPSGWGIALGWWRKTGFTEDEALLAATLGHETEPWWENDENAKTELRQAVARISKDIDHELVVLDALGLMNDEETAL